MKQVTISASVRNYLQIRGKYGWYASIEKLDVVEDQIIQFECMGSIFKTVQIKKILHPNQTEEHYEYDMNNFLYWYKYFYAEV